MSSPVVRGQAFFDAAPDGARDFQHLFDADGSSIVVLAERVAPARRPRACPVIKNNLRVGLLFCKTAQPLSRRVRVAAELYVAEDERPGIVRSISKACPQIRPRSPPTVCAQHLRHGSRIGLRHLRPVLHCALTDFSVWEKVTENRHNITLW